MLNENRPAPDTRRRPFAFAVDKLDHVFAIRPTLAAAIESARDRFSRPSAALGINAWFPDGTSETIPYELICTPDRSAWISPEEAQLLDRTRYSGGLNGAANG